MNPTGNSTTNYVFKFAGFRGNCETALRERLSMPGCDVFTNARHRWRTHRIYTRDSVGSAERGMIARICVTLLYTQRLVCWQRYTRMAHCAIARFIPKYSTDVTMYVCIL